MALYLTLWLAAYIIVGSMARWFTVKFPNNPLSDVLLFVHG